MSNMLQMFLLGTVHFYSLFFIAKYFEYIYLPFRGLMILFLIQLLSFLANIWQPTVSRFRYFVFAIFLLSAYNLSNAKLGTSLLEISFSCVGIFIYIQSEILRKLKSIPNIREGYFFELFGGLVGIGLYYFLTAKVGFPGFFVFSTLTIGYVLFSELTKAKLLVILGALLGLSFAIGEPQPIIDKRGRSLFLKDGELLRTFWSPNGHTELIQSAFMSDNLLISFEGGALRSHIYKFDGNYERLKEDYLKSKSTGIWGLDVVLPHFLRPKSEQVALLGCVGGQEILAAKAFGAKSIDVVDINESAQYLVGQVTKEFNGGIYSPPANVFTFDGRHFIRNSEKTYDIIQIYSAESASLSSAMGSLFRPSSLFTEEALRDYDAHLQEDGILQITINSYLKMKNTLEKAFGEKVFFEEAKILTLKADGRENDLVTFLYKKNGWSREDLNKTLSWLKNDPLKKWTVLVHPHDSFESKQVSLASYSMGEDFLKASTDNWPFLRIVKDPISSPGIKNFLLALFGVLVVLVLPYKKSEISPKSRYGAFFMGATYSLAQSTFILEIQRLIGLPGLGLSLAVGLCLLMSGLAAIGGSAKMPRNAFIVLSLLVGPLLYYYKLIGLLLLAVLVFAQGHIFSDLITRNRLRLNYIFLFNGLGFSLGLILFNLILILFGMWQTILVLGFFYLIVALLSRVSTAVDTLGPPI